MKKFKVADYINYIILAILAVVCVLPFIHVLAISLSDSAAAIGGEVYFFPKNINFDSYSFALSRQKFTGSIFNSVKRLALGITVNMLLTCLAAYPLSKSKEIFKGRNFFAWFFILTMLLNGGMVTTYLVVNATSIRNTIWALVLPNAVPAFNVALLLNHFRTIPKELSESAFLDGASHFRVLFWIFIPISKPTLMTLVIFQAVGHWNDWLEGIIYLDRIDMLPLASYMRNVLQKPNFDTMNFEQIKMATQVTERNFSAAQIIISSMPIIIIYPFLQRYFVKGMMLGSLKG